MNLFLKFILSVVIPILGSAQRKTKLTVHLVHHSHDDVGWLKTIDDYYYGNNNYIQNAKIKSIYDTVFQALHENPARKFSFVEMKFMSMWWSNQTLETKNEVR